jgi:DNA polymerase III gamma/tau subunit
MSRKESVMVNSYLITATNYEERIEKAKKLVGFWEPHPDFLLIQAHPSISINDIRQIQKFLSRRPYQAKIKAVVLAEAELMTIPAQNAFLKTLEEPPANSLIVLGSQNQDQLLATIISRCQIINLKSKPVMIDRQEMNKHQNP